MKKVALVSSAALAAASQSFAAMTADPSTGLSSIEGYADSAIGVAIGIGVVVLGWPYVKRLVRKG